MRRFFIAAALAAFVALFTAAQSADTKRRLPAYQNPTGREFPILAYHTFESPELVTLQNFRDFKDAGFNIAFSYHFDNDWLEKTISFCDELGLKLMLEARRERLGGMQGFVSRYSGVVKDHNGTRPRYPAVIGFHVWDEPSVSQFPEAQRWLYAAADTLHRDMLLDVVMYGSATPKAQYESYCYECYAETFNTIFRPQFISYDHYAIWEIKDQGTHNHVIHRDYYRNLEIISKLARDNDIPFWPFVLSTAHVQYPVPTKADIALQISSSLAYGAQGIQYYGYGPHKGGKRYYSQSVYHDAPIDTLGRKTPLWHIIHDCNRDLQSYADVFLGMRVRNVWHTGSNIPEGTVRLGGADAAPLPAEIRGISSNVDSPSLIVSHFVNGERNYLMIVNRNLYSARRVYTDVSSRVTRVETRATATREKSELRNPGTHGKTYTDLLPPGEFVIFSW